ncbi:MAG: hypothetical protein LLG20_23495 [Acidobacteriales bacterium]|nr:hypothetical protein [Terriglobales bacterium]
MQEFLLPETTVREDGAGPAIGLGAAKGTLIDITLGITRIIEQESLDASIWGSADGVNWGAKPITQFPQKFYCGTYSLQVNLADQADVAFLQVRWKVHRWGHGSAAPLFGLYVFAETAAANAAEISAA